MRKQYEERFEKLHLDLRPDFAPLHYAGKYMQANANLGRSSLEWTTAKMCVRRYGLALLELELLPALSVESLGFGGSLDAPSSLPQQRVGILTRGTFPTTGRVYLGFRVEPRPYLSSQS